MLSQHPMAAVSIVVIVLSFGMVLTNKSLIEHRREEAARVAARPAGAPTTFQIKYPADGAVVTSANVTVYGVAKPKATIKYRRRSVVADGAGQWSMRVKLKTGENRLVFMARDRNGGLEQAIVTVRYY